jgi:hypothetical protein
MANIQEFPWVCQLTVEQPTMKCRPAENDSDFLINSLILKTVVLGSSAVGGQRNLVAILTRDHEHKFVLEKPIYPLTNGKTDIIRGLNLTLAYDRRQAVEFKLAKGNGQVIITCTHLVEKPSAEKTYKFKFRYLLLLFALIAVPFIIYCKADKTRLTEFASESNFFGKVSPNVVIEVISFLVYFC